MNYYNEKYGVATNTTMNMGARATQKQQPVTLNNPQYYTISNLKPGVSSGVNRNEAANRSSSPSLVSGELLAKSKNGQASSKNLKESSINEGKSGNSEETVAKSKTNDSLSLLAVYSDSEEEMES